MYSVDFEYDGIKLSDLGYIICDFNYSSGTVNISAGSTISFNKVAKNNGTKFGLSGTEYGECIQANFAICKDPDIYDLEDREITDDELRYLMRWLNRSSFNKLVFLSDKILHPCSYNASFNAEKILIGDVLYGLELSMDTDSPFGYGDKYTSTLTFSNSITTATFVDVSDNIGDMYISVKITCLSSGDLQLTNTTASSVTLIKNCVSGEVIDIDGETMIISSSISGHKIYDDFNFVYPKVTNTLTNKNNVFSASIPCSVEISYYPLVKGGV